jgi:hypothetical protein
MYENGYSIPDPKLATILPECRTIVDATASIEAGLLTKYNRSCLYFKTDLEEIKQAVHRLVYLLNDE